MPKNKHTFNAIFNTYLYRQKKNKNNLPFTMTVMELINSNETTNLLTFTYSESNYYDENIPKKIADDFKLHWIFKNLDNGLNLFYLDEVTKLNEGNCLYAGGAQVLDTFQILNLEKKGIIHTGMIGDVVVGTFYEQKEEKINYDIKSGAYSNTLISKLKEKLKTFPIENYRNEEIFKFYTRGFLGANMGSPCIFISELESFSPFYNLDFLEYCLTIPLEKRWNYYIYDKWVITKYPKATKEKIDYFFAFITYGAIGILKKWFSDEMLLKKAEIVDFTNGFIDSAAECLR